MYGNMLHLAEVKSKGQPDAMKTELIRSPSGDLGADVPSFLEERMKFELSQTNANKAM